MRTVMLLQLAILLVTSGCEVLRASDPRCRMAPADPTRYGPCEAVVGWIHADGRCQAVSGCECDAQCQGQEVPFRSEEECQSTCVAR